MSLEEQFQAAVFLIQQLPKTGPLVPSNDERLQFYSLFKQATVGKNDRPQPLFVNIIERAKWDNWTKLGDMSKTDAMSKYVQLVRAMIEKIAKTLNVTEWLAKINPELPEKIKVITATA